MGEFIIEGFKSLELIQSLCTNDASKLSIGQAQYSCMTNNKGGIVDDLIIGNVESEKYRLVVNANTKDYFKKHSELEEKDRIILAVQGQYSQELLENMFSTDLSKTYFDQNKLKKYFEKIQIIYEEDSVHPLKRVLCEGFVGDTL